LIEKNDLKNGSQGNIERNHNFEKAPKQKQNAFHCNLVFFNATFKNRFKKQPLKKTVHLSLFDF
jgi:hypothetical protein